MQGSLLRGPVARPSGHSNSESGKNPFSPYDVYDSAPSAKPIDVGEPVFLEGTLSESIDSRIPPITMELTHSDRVRTQICSQSPIQWNLPVLKQLPTLLAAEAVEKVDSREEPLEEDVRKRSCLSVIPVERQLNASSIWKPRRKLTLSAFRRPEHTIRLTQSDPSRRLDAEYDLHGTGGRGVLGHGAYSTVRLAVRRKDGVKVAVKIISKHEALRSRRLRRVQSSSDSRYYLEEWEILRRLHDHPNVITLLDVFETAEEIHLVTEYCPGGELFDAIQKKQRRNRRNGKGNSSEYQAAQITSQILKALVDVHAAGLVHRDVKPENILLGKPQEGESVHVKLCDFGVARPLRRQPLEEEPTNMGGNATAASSSACVSVDGEMSPLTPGSRSRSFSTIGSDYYAAPELTYGGSYDTAVDIYSLGVTLYILLCGFPPVFACATLSVAPGESDDDDNAEEVLFPDTYWSNVSHSAKALLRKMLHPDATLRVSAVEALRDPWIENHLMSPSIKPILSPPQATLDLDLVRSRLYKSLGGIPREQSSSPTRTAPTSTFQTPSRAPIAHIAPASAPPTRLKRKRQSLSCVTCHSPRKRRVERRASTTALMALADLYRGVAPPSVLAAAAAAAVDHTSVDVGGAPTTPPKDADTGTSSFATTTTTSPVAALSF